MEWLTDTFNSLVGVSPVPEPHEDKKAETTPDDVQTRAADLQLQNSGQLTKTQLLKFFEAGTEQLKSEIFRQRLKDAQFLKQDLEDIVTAAQKNVFEEQGIAGDFGVTYLGKVNSEYKQDDEVMRAFLQFVNLEEDALAEAEMSPEMYAQQQRLMALAKGHAAEMMERMKDLSPEQQKAFVAQQMQNVDRLRTQATSSTPNPQGNSMTAVEQAAFFKSMQSR